MEMTRDLERARNELDTGRYTCVLCKGEKTYFSNEHLPGSMRRPSNKDAVLRIR